MATLVAIGGGGGGGHVSTPVWIVFGIAFAIGLVLAIARLRRVGWRGARDEIVRGSR